MKRVSILALVAMAVVALAPQANAMPIFTFGFDCITNNNATSAAIGQAQFFVDVTGVDATHVSFTFRNTGPQVSSISEIYFDSGPLVSIASILNTTGVNFSLGANPANLPGGNNLADPFVATSGLMLSAANPAPKQGVNPGEQIGVVCSIVSGKTLADIITDIGTGNLRMGVHAVSIGTNANSEAFVNEPNPPTIPEPATLAIMGLGLVTVIRRTSRSR
jgi:hypothetical protein